MNPQAKEVLQTRKITMMQFKIKARIKLTKPIKTRMLVMLMKTRKMDSKKNLMIVNMPIKRKNIKRRISIKRRIRTKRRKRRRIRKKIVILILKMTIQ